MAVVRERLQRADRLLRRQDFRYVVRHGRRVRCGCLVLVVAVRRGEDQLQAGPRLGITVGRSVGKAVVRNRVKRRIREGFRRERAQMRENLDIVVIADHTAAHCSAAELGEALRAGAQAAELVS